MAQPRNEPGIPDLARCLVRKRDFYAGTLMVLFGLVMAVHGPSYPVGTLMHIGPGFLPTVLGVIQVVLGILISGLAIGKSVDRGDRILPEKCEWWGWCSILAGPALFMLIGSYCGMIPGAFACVFVSALGDRSATLKSAFVLASIVTTFGALVFSYLLQVPLPLFQWRLS